MLTEETKRVGNCGRKLTNLESVERGIGSICLRKRTPEETERPELIPPQNHRKITFKDLPTTEPAKMYYASRGIFGVNVTVENNGRTYHLQHIAYHSPDGFEWGYGGSGPSDLARSILYDCAGIKIADTFYQDFKWDFIACMPEQGFVIPEEVIREWLEEKVKEAQPMK